VDQQHEIFADDALQSAQSLNSESNTPAEIEDKFNTISYCKGRPTDFLETLSKVTKPFSTVSHVIIINPFAVTVLTLKNHFVLTLEFIYSF